MTIALIAIVVIVGICVGVVKRLDARPQHLTYAQLKANQWLVYARPGTLGNYCRVHLSNSCSHTPAEAEEERAYAEAMRPIEDAFTREMAEVERAYDREQARLEHERVQAEYAANPPADIAEINEATSLAAQGGAHLAKVRVWGNVSPIRTDRAAS